MNGKRNEADVAVIGSGISGLTAALTAAEGGAKVIVFEKQRSPGGTSNFLQGMFAVESEIQRKKYILHTRDEAFKNFMDYKYAIKFKRRLVADKFYSRMGLFDVQVLTKNNTWKSLDYMVDVQDGFVMSKIKKKCLEDLDFLNCMFKNIVFISKDEYITRDSYIDIEYEKFSRYIGMHPSTIDLYTNKIYSKNYMLCSEIESTPEIKNVRMNILVRRDKFTGKVTETEISDNELLMKKFFGVYGNEFESRVESINGKENFKQTIFDFGE